jgi:hypothetical protein
MLRIVDSCRPEPLAAMVPATPDDRTWVVDTGKTVHVGPGDGGRRHELGSRALTVGQMRLADLLSNGNDNPFPADHRAEPERDRDRHLYPGRDELCRGVERLLVSIQPRDFLLRQIVVPILHQIAQRFVGEIHVVSGIADR